MGLDTCNVGAIAFTNIRLSTDGNGDAGSIGLRSQYALENYQ